MAVLSRQSVPRPLKSQAISQRISGDHKQGPDCEGDERGDEDDHPRLRVQRRRDRLTGVADL